MRILLEWDVFIEGGAVLLILQILQKRTELKNRTGWRDPLWLPVTIG